MISFAQIVELNYSRLNIKTAELCFQNYKNMQIRYNNKYVCKEFLNCCHEHCRVPSADYKLKIKQLIGIKFRLTHRIFDGNDCLQWKYKSQINVFHCLCSYYSTYIGLDCYWNHMVLVIVINCVVSIWFSG